MVRGPGAQGRRRARLQQRCANDGMRRQPWRNAACAGSPHDQPLPPPGFLLLHAGEARRAREKIEAYKHLSQDQKAKLLAALEAKERAGGGQREPGPQELRTEVGGWHGRRLGAGRGCAAPARRHAGGLGGNLGLAGPVAFAAVDDPLLHFAHFALHFARFASFTAGGRAHVHH